jgi:choline dehydrogenase-like flavoprotein
VAPYDVVIVGSGAGGGMAAYVLTKAGARVAMLEAGGEWFASKNATMLYPSYATPRRGRATRIRPFGEFDACDGGWESTASRTRARRAPASTGGAAAC